MSGPVWRVSGGHPIAFGIEWSDPARVPAETAALGRALVPALSGRGVAGGDLQALEVALEELITNLGKFGDPAAAPGGTVRAEGTIRVDPETVTLDIADNAAPFDPTRHPRPDTDPEALLARPVGGLGLHMLFQLFGEAAYRREDGRNRTVWRRRRSG